MNFIVGSLLYHANDVMAFWLFVSLIEDCEMRDIYMRELPGLFKHSHIINHLITTHLTDLSDHFVKNKFCKYYRRNITLESRCMLRIGSLGCLRQ